MSIQIPPNSILSNTAAIVTSCEIAETDPSSHRSSSSSSTPPPTFILVTELASLLHLGRYNHARHLWRRYRTEALSVSGSKCESNTTTTTTTVSTTTPGSQIDQANTTQNNDLYQFRLLWNAAQPLLRAINGEGSLLPSSSSPSSSSCATEVYSLLQSCMDTQLQPLAKYASELYHVSVRDYMAELMETVYDSVQTTKCQIMLGYHNEKEGNNNNNAERMEIAMNEYLEKRGWARSVDDSSGRSDVWIPASPSPSALQESEKLSQDDKIDFLTGVIGFMEKQRLNA